MKRGFFTPPLVILAPGGSKSLKRSLLWHGLGHLTWGKAVEEISPKVDWPSNQSQPTSLDPCSSYVKKGDGKDELDNLRDSVHCRGHASGLGFSSIHPSTSVY